MKHEIHAQDPPNGVNERVHRLLRIWARAACNETLGNCRISSVTQIWTIRIHVIHTWNRLRTVLMNDTPPGEVTSSLYKVDSSWAAPGWQCQRPYSTAWSCPLVCKQKSTSVSTSSGIRRHSLSETRVMRRVSGPTNNSKTSIQYS